MNIVQLNNLEDWYLANFESQLKGRQILFDDIHPLINNLSSKFKKEQIGFSENKIPIYKISIGLGSIKIFSWSQMHGNESTGTKAVFDLFKLFETPPSSHKNYIETILTNCTLQFIVLLNPDGAINFTRENARNIDLNRDAVDKKAVESKLLRKHLDSFKPQFCFNLHDQRSIFNVEGTPNPATISFLAPSEDVERTLTEGRKETMSVIVAMNSLLQQLIPNHIGRYTDEFYPTATGDNFQKLGYNTILIEAGHFKNDYDREITRKYNFYALLQGIYFISTASSFKNYKPYFQIPNNDKMFLDIIYKNIQVVENNETTKTDLGIQFKFKVINGKLVRYEAIEQTGDLSDYYSDNVVNAEKLNINELKLSNS
ncbi:M14 family zinc carboxypeptidase [Lutibacter maritimus]|uniref:Zinc carboxypeptidase n=1 Tax=Lutibacter maritimus TaxID=593133 RepID=A0A1I6P1H5_9FLAO|nr:M14 family zinc carboxypeptidase [Lutibacter maritimus]SFS34037.1 Zinc carboxypeptidase [Lutibacter maritimus]